MRWFRKRGEKTEHRYVAERLSAYMDGELSSKEHAIIEYHLDTCQDCRWNLETLRQTVQWTRELPTVPIPRVFTIPVEVPPVRAPRRAWAAPLLQGATALVALLLVFVVAGDYLFTGSLLPQAPESQVVMERAPAEGVTSTLEVEEPVPGEIEKEAVVEAPTVVAEKAALSPTPLPEPTQPLPQAAPPTEAVEAAAEAEVTFTVTPRNSGMGVTSFGTPAEGITETEDASTTVEAPSMPSPVPTVTETATSEPTPTTLPTEIPTLAAIVEPTITTPTVVAEVPAEAAMDEGAQEQALAAVQRDSLVFWLGVAEIALMVALILLGTITVVVMIRQRRVG